MLRLAATIASGLGYGLIFPPLAWDASAWVVLVPLALALRGVGPARACALAALFGLLGTLACTPWLVWTVHDHFEKSWLFSLTLWFGIGATALAPWYGAAFGAYALGVRRLPTWARPLLFAAAWVSAEFARVHLGLRSPWTRLGDAMIDVESVRALAAWGGVYAVSALVAAANAAIAEGLAALRETRAPRTALVVAATAATLVLLVLLPGPDARNAAPGARPLDVALVQGAVPAELRWNRAGAGRVLRRYGGLTRDHLRETGDDPPDLVVWPESALQTSLAEPSLGPALLRLAGSVPILLGLPHHAGENGSQRHYNSAALLRQRQVHGLYHKRRLLLFSETQPFGGAASLGARGDLDRGSYTPGEQAAVFEFGPHRVAPLICMESLYPALAREARQLGATAIANLSHDGWFRGRGGRRQHLAMTRFRAIETGLPIVRATSRGVSAVIAPDGRIVSASTSAEHGVLRAVAPPATAPPLYARTGDVFAWGCTALAFGLPIGLAIAARSRAERSTSYQDLPVSH